MEVKTDTKALVFQLPFALHRIPHSFSGLQPTQMLECLKCCCDTANDVTVNTDACDHSLNLQVLTVLKDV